MGLSVSVYKNFKEVETLDESDFTAYVLYKDWEWKIKNLNKNANYVGERVSRPVDYSYSTHSRFRAWLLSLVGRADLLKPNGEVDFQRISNEVPFSALIDFADNEGCLDFEVSEQLYHEFVKWHEHAKNSNPQNSSFKQYYEYWLECFDIARDGGVVVFH